ncbi:MAG: hypothetical protein QW303_00650 [Nitrososphaerota archaeon]
MDCPIVLLVNNKIVLLDLANEKIVVFRRVDHAVLWSGKPTGDHIISKSANFVFEHKDEIPKDLPVWSVYPTEATFYDLPLYYVNGNIPDFDIQMEVNNLISRFRRNQKFHRRGQP